MNRRQFLSTVCSTGVAVGLAGCTAPVDGESVVARERIVQTGPAGEGGETREVTPARSAAFDVTNLIFEVAGDRGVVVAGDVENASEQPFSLVEVEVTLYDENEVEDDLLDSNVRSVATESLAPGEAWQWAVKFPNDPVPEIDYYAVLIRGKR